MYAIITGREQDTLHHAEYTTIQDATTVPVTCNQRVSPITSATLFVND
jgi:hypothetical protein